MYAVSQMVKGKAKKPSRGLEDEGCVSKPCLQDGDSRCSALTGETAGNTVGSGRLVERRPSIEKLNGAWLCSGRQGGDCVGGAGIQRLGGALCRGSRRAPPELFKHSLGDVEINDTISKLHIVLWSS